MTWHLSEDISFCRLDGRLYFLDLQRDCYFQLSRSLENILLDYLENPYDASIDVSMLVNHNLISQEMIAIGSTGQSKEIEHPDQSVLETPCLNGRIPPSVLLDVFLIVTMMHWQLRIRRLKPILCSLEAYRRARASFPHNETEVQHRVAEAATAFNSVRPYVPIDTCCLIDSLSMIRFLAGRGMHAHLLMGVACDPFSAHAWVQHGHLVLNDTVGNAQAHIPVRVI